MPRRALSEGINSAFDVDDSDITDRYIISAGRAPSWNTHTTSASAITLVKRPSNNSHTTMSGTSTPSLASSTSATVSGSFSSISRPIPRPAMLDLTRNILGSMMSDMKLRSSDVRSYMSAFQDGTSTTPADHTVVLPTFECKAMRPESKAAVNEIILDVSDLHSRAEKGDLTR